MYTLFLQKKKGEATPFPLTKQLHDLLTCTGANRIFVSPGHLSKRPKQIEDLLDGFISIKGVQRIGIGNKYKSKSLNMYEAHLHKHGKLWEVDRSESGDHRKMVFIFKYEKPLPKLERKNMNAILGQIEVIGVAIGSSNFSFPTYGPITPSALHADKGEADIIMFKDDESDQSIQDYVNLIAQDIEVYRGQRPQMVLSRSITPVPHDFLKQMFKETLELALK